VIVESSALQAVASAACLAKSLTPQPVKVETRANETIAIGIFIRKSCFISALFA
jgi:hypothetical protein